MNTIRLLWAAVLLGLPSPAQVAAFRGLALFSTPPLRLEGWRLVLDRRLPFWNWPGAAQVHRRELRGAGLPIDRSEGMAALARALGLDEGRTRWVLVGPGRRAQAFGEGIPDFPRIEAILRREVGPLRMETLGALLRDHPDHGEARLAMAELALTPSEDAHGLLPAELPEAEEALEGLMRVPDWPWQVDLEEGRRPGSVPTPPGLGPRLQNEAPRLQGSVQAMADGVLAALASDPGRGGLQSNLAFLLRVLDDDGADRLMGRIEEVEPLPGQAWPPLALVHAQADVLRRRGKWEELLQQARAWRRRPDPLFLDREAWKRHLHREGTLLAYEAMARSWREGWEILPGALRGLREHAGGDYGELAGLVLGGARLPEGPSRELTELRQQAGLPALKAPAMPAPLPPWRVGLADPKELPRLRESFDHAPELIQWLPSERLLEPQAGLKGAWALSLGGEPKGTGEALPGALADLLRAGRPGRLWVASDRVDHQPQAPGPRRLRLGLLLQRLPCRPLESMLAEDLSRTRLGAELDRAGLDENLWYLEARRAIPVLEEHLRHWPMDGERWAALAFWTAFLPAHRGPVALAEELPSPRPGLSFRLCLPASAHEQVGSLLQRQEAWTALRAWFESTWERLLALPPEAPETQARVRELGPTLQSFLDLAYARLGLSGPRRRLQETARELEGREGAGR